MSKVYTTKKGTNLPLMNLKGKDYMMVAYRIQWLEETETKYEITTEFPLLNAEETVARATITLFNDDGSVRRKVSATKRETKKDFSDHTEKAETSAIGRAVALLGFGTQFALADMEEGTRLADSPLEQVSGANAAAPAPTGSQSSGNKVASFRRNTKAESAPAPSAPVAVAKPTASDW
jgi:hypothetical protein